ncbi:MAG TPA: ketopantoate reductase family protein [Pseudonocardiaceae bacterium]|jgi:2-dehydropantoate 2-reductase|nr:ketopantoate reductase family protein [Pseudonocardiaceae bacterium]
MRILVVGAGATGGYFGAKLAMAGRDVTFLVRPGRAAALRERGLRIVASDEDHTVRPAVVTAGELTEPYDLVLVSVKASALDAAIKDFAPAVGPSTTIIPFLNGMAHLDTLTTRFGTSAVLAGVVFIASTLNDDGDIARLAPMRSIGFGEQDGSRPPRVADVEAALSGADFDVEVYTDGVSRMWSKWVFITTVAGVTCLMRAPIGDVVAVPGGAGLGPGFAAEGAAIAAASGHPLTEQRLAGIDATVTQQGSSLTASMFRDLDAGLPTEVEHVFGDLVARARTLVVDTPLLDLATMHLRVHQHRVAGA